MAVATLGQVKNHDREWLSTIATANSLIRVFSWVSKIQQHNVVKIVRLNKLLTSDLQMETVYSLISEWNITSHFQGLRGTSYTHNQTLSPLPSPLIRNN